LPIDQFEDTETAYLTLLELIENQQKENKDSHKHNKEVRAKLWKSTKSEVDFCGYQIPIDVNGITVLTVDEWFEKRFDY
jgi:hypothetical protein